MKLCLIGVESSASGVTIPFSLRKVLKDATPVVSPLDLL